MLYSYYCDSRTATTVPHPHDNLRAYVADYNEITKAIKDDNIDELRSLCPDLRGLKPRYAIDYSCDYQSYHGKWGKYNPVYSLRIVASYITHDNYVFKRVVHSEQLGNHQRDNRWQRSKLASSKVTQYRDARVDTTTLRFAGRVLETERVISLGKDEYHLNDTDSLTAGYKALQRKIAARKQAAADKRSANKAKKAAMLDKPHTFDSVRADFGFCRVGLAEFCHSLGIDLESTLTLNQVKSVWQAASRETRETLLSRYDNELRTAGIV